jgi:hypothetical protein
MSNGLWKSRYGGSLPSACAPAVPPSDAQSLCHNAADTAIPLNGRLVRSTAYSRLLLVLRCAQVRRHLAYPKRSTPISCFCSGVIPPTARIRLSSPPVAMSDKANKLVSYSLGFAALQSAYAGTRTEPLDA